MKTKEEIHESIGNFFMKYGRIHIIVFLIFLSAHQFVHFWLYSWFLIAWSVTPTILYVFYNKMNETVARALYFHSFIFLALGILVYGPIFEPLGEIVAMFCILSIFLLYLGLSMRFKQVHFYVSPFLSEYIRLFKKQKYKHVILVYGETKYGQDLLFVKRKNDPFQKYWKISLREDGNRFQIILFVKEKEETPKEISAAVVQLKQAILERKLQDKKERLLYTLGTKEIGVYTAFDHYI